MTVNPADLVAPAVPVITEALDELDYEAEFVNFRYTNRGLIVASHNPLLVARVMRIFEAAGWRCRVRTDANGAPEQATFLPPHLI